MNGVSPSGIFSEMTVEALMEAYLHWVTPVFMRYRLMCVGCPFCRFHTLAEIALIYDLDLNTLLKELDEAIVAGLKDDPK